MLSSFLETTYRGDSEAIDKAHTGPIKHAGLGTRPRMEILEDKG